MVLRLQGEWQSQASDSFNDLMAQLALLGGLYKLIILDQYTWNDVLDALRTHLLLGSTHSWLSS